jgi:cytochrome c-type biogenesis protein CcmH/NrfG
MDNKERGEVAYNLGVQAAEGGDMESALEHYTTAIQLDPRNVHGMLDDLDLHFPDE